MKRVATALGSMLWLSCSAPEDAHVEQRCAADLTCPDALVCYRGFCVEADAQDPDLPAVPPVVTPVVPPSVPPVAPPSVPAMVPPSVPPIVPEDAGAALSLNGADAQTSQAADAGPVPGFPWWATWPWNPNAGPITDVPSADPAPSTPVADGPTGDGLAACVALCTDSAKGGKDCKLCVTELVGGEPNKVCRESARGQQTPAVSELCGALCGVDTQDVLGCHDHKSCSGKSCDDGDN
jgi:hypothetical protein